MKEYYIHDGNKKSGPLSLDELNKIEITTQTFVWYEGLSDWTLASEIPELKKMNSINKPLPPPFLKSLNSDNKENVKQNLKEKIIEAFNLTSKQYVLAGIIAIIFLLVFYLINLNSRLTDEIKRVKVDNANISTQASNAQQQVQMQEDAVRRLDQARKASIDSANQIIYRKQRDYRDRWSKYIQKSSPIYSVSIWGGISDLSFNVSNLTEYPIDEIELEVRYILKNGTLFQTEVVKLKDMIPYSQRKVTAPSTDRGTTIIVDFKSIKAQSFNFCYGYNISNGQTNDPWLCK